MALKWHSKKLNGCLPTLVVFCDCTHTHAVPNCNNLKFFKINLRISKFLSIELTSFGQFLKKLRQERNLSQRDLAKLLDVSAESILKWEKDRFLPGKESIIKLAKVFQVEELTLTEHQQKVV